MRAVIATSCIAESVTKANRRVDISSINWLPGLSEGILNRSRFQWTYY